MLIVIKMKSVQQFLILWQIQLQLLFNLSAIMHFLRTLLFSYSKMVYDCYNWNNLVKYFLENKKCNMSFQENYISNLWLLWSILDFLFTCLKHEFWLACEIGRNKNAKVLHLLYLLFLFRCQGFEDAAPIENLLDPLIL